MIDNFSKIYEIGKELGLSRIEINSSFFNTNKSYFKYLVKKYLTISILFLLIWIIIFIILNVYFGSSVGSTYGQGTKYSTVKIKDFRRRKRNFFLLFIQI